MLRSPGVVCDQSSNAARAAATALSTSASVPLGTSAIVSSVAGLITGMVSAVDASAHSPSMNMRRRGVAVSVMSLTLCCDGRGVCWGARALILAMAASDDQAPDASARGQPHPAAYVPTRLFMYRSD